MKLYYTPGACSLASHIVAADGGLKLDLDKVNLKEHLTEGGQDYYTVNPKGYVPALVRDDGSLLTENVALLTFLGDQTGAMPKGDAHYRALEWLAFITSEIHKSFSPLFRGAEGDAAQQAKDKILKRFTYADEKLTGDYLLGASFSPPDAYLYVMLRWAAKMGIGIEGLHRLEGFKARMEQRPGVKAALAAEGIAT